MAIQYVIKGYYYNEKAILNAPVQQLTRNFEESNCIHIISIVKVGIMDTL